MQCLFVGQLGKFKFIMKCSRMFFSVNKILPLLITSTLLLSACGEDTTSSHGPEFGNTETNTTTDFDQSLLISSLVDNVITPAYQEFSVAAAQQELTVSNYCQQEQAMAEGNSSSDLVNESKLLAQDSWRTAMNHWQYAEVMQLSPLLIGDGALRDNIYSWPTQNTCGVDLDVTYFKEGTINGKPYDIASRTASRKSLVALEYLLFNDNLDHTCTGSTQPVDWNNQTDTYRKIARCEYAAEVAKDIIVNSETLLTQWLGNNDDIVGYANELKAAGESGSEFASAHEAVNKLSDALFYMDKMTKSAKLAKPLGIDLNECGSQACPEVVESKFSHHSLENIRNNIQAFKQFIQGSGTDGIGFRDYLIDVGDQSTADSLDADIEQVLTSTQAYQASLGETLVSNPDQVDQTHTEVKNITDKLKSDFITSLSLELPATAAGDND